MPEPTFFLGVFGLFLIAAFAVAMTLVGDAERRREREAADAYARAEYLRRTYRAEGREEKRRTMPKPPKAQYTGGSGHSTRVRRNLLDDDSVFYDNDHGAGYASHNYAGHHHSGGVGSNSHAHGVNGHSHGSAHHHSDHGHGYGGGSHSHGHSDGGGGGGDGGGGGGGVD